MLESVAGGGGAKDSCPMSSIIAESVDPVVLGLEVVRSDGGQGSPAMAASRLSPIVGVWEKAEVVQQQGPDDKLKN